MVDTGEMLEHAVQAGDWANALRLLLDAWRTKRSTRLADVIDAVSERVAAEHGPEELFLAIRRVV